MKYQLKPGADLREMRAERIKLSALNWYELRNALTDAKERIFDISSGYKEVGYILKFTEEYGWFSAESKDATLRTPDFIAKYFEPIP